MGQHVATIVDQILLSIVRRFTQNNVIASANSGSVLGILAVGREVNMVELDLNYARRACDKL